jgi:RNA polymerase sigma-70 factor (ECF subfamily)
LSPEYILNMEANTEELWLQLGNRLKAFILSKIHDETIAEDILQEVFIKIHSKIDTLHDDLKIQPWIYQITRNLIIDYFRSVKKDKQKLPYLFESVEDTPNEFLEETLRDMVKMMDELPPEYCEALCLTELGEMSQKEYAEKVGISYSGGKARVQRAKKKLKDNLMKCCHYQFDRYGTVIDILPVNCCCCHV